MSAQDPGADVGSVVELLRTDKARGTVRSPVLGLELIRHGLGTEYLRGAYSGRAADDVQAVVRRSRDGVPSALILQDKPMETALLGVATCEFADLVISDAPEDADDVSVLLDGAMTAASERGYDLVILRLNADLIGALHAAQCAGFRVCEATVGFLAPGHPSGYKPPEGVDVIRYDPGSDALAKLDLGDLGVRTSLWGGNHFRADRRLAPARIDDYYSEWVTNIITGAWSDSVFVASFGGEVVGLHSELRNSKLFDRTGVELTVCEWTVGKHPGVGSALFHAGCSSRRPESPFTFWETQLRNVACLRAIQRIGLTRPTGGAYTLHGWIDEWQAATSPS